MDLNCRCCFYVNIIDIFDVIIVIIGDVNGRGFCHYAVVVGELVVFFSGIAAIVTTTLTELLALVAVAEAGDIRVTGGSVVCVKVDNDV